MLFATDDDSTELRALIQGIVIEAARIYARHMDEAAGGSEPDELLLRLTKRTSWQEVLHSSLFSYPLEKPWQPSLPGLAQFRFELGQRYDDEIRYRCLEPFAISLKPNYTCNGAIKKLGHDSFSFAEMWVTQESPADRSAVQFFETVGLLTKNSEYTPDVLFIDGEVKRAIARGRGGQITFDGGHLQHCEDIETLVGSLT